VTGLRPGFALSVDGVDVAVEASWECRVEDQTGIGGDRLEVTIDGAPKYEWPRIGAVLEVAIGYRDEGLGLETVGSYWVESVRLEGPPWKLRVVGTPGPVAGVLKEDRKRAWTDTTIEQIIADIATTAELPYQVSSSIADQVIGHVEQRGESDLDLLAQLGRRLNAVSRVAGGKLVFVPRHEGLSAGGLPLAEITVERNRWRSYAVDQTARPDVGQITALVRGKPIVNSHKVGPGKPTAYEFGTGKPAKKLDKVYATKDEAEAAAAAYRQSQHVNLWKLSGTLLGDARILAEQQLYAPDLHPDVPDRWTVASVVHTVTSAGFTSQIQAERTTPR